MKRAGALLLWAALSFAQGGASVEGTVTSSATHAGVPGVTVRIRTGKTGYTTSTDVSGNFQIAGVAPGQYNSTFEKSGFVALDLPTFGQPGLNVGASGTARLDVQIDPFAKLRGRVLDPDGKPAPQVTVELNATDSETTDADGRFELKELRPGTYTLRARPPETGEKEKEQLVPTYFPSTVSAAEAEKIIVRGGAEQDGYEIHLRRMPVYSVRGVVRDENGKPLPDCPVKLLSPGETRLLTGRAVLGGPNTTQFFLNLRRVETDESSVMSGKDGSFVFDSVRAGQWDLRAELDPRHSGDETYLVWSALVPVMVTNQDIDALELRVDQGFNVGIAFDFADRSPAAGSFMPAVSLASLDGLPIRLAARKTPDGIAIDHVLPGSYEVVPTPGMPPGYYPASVIVGGRDVIGQPVELSAGMPPIRITYKPNPGTVRGTVDQGAGTSVLLWPEGNEIPYMVAWRRADAGGAFEFTNVAPGDYTVIAFDRVPPTGGSQSYVLGAMAAGTRVQVQEGGSASVELSVTRWAE